MNSSNKQSRIELAGSPSATIVFFYYLNQRQTFYCHEISKCKGGMRNPFPKHSHYIALIKSDISYSLSVDENALLIVIPAINSKPRGRKFPTKEIN